jgi:hypothetical protein
MNPPDLPADGAPEASWDAWRSADPTPFVVVLRFAVPEATAPAAATAQRDRLAGVLDVLSGCPGFRGGWVGRAVDPAEDGPVDRWLLVQHWRSVGEYRHALSSVEVRVAVLPVLSTALDEPSAFEVLHGHSADGSESPWGASGPSTSARSST